MAAAGGRKKRRRKKILIVAIILVLLLGIGAFVFLRFGGMRILMMMGMSQQTEETAVSSAQTATATIGSISNTIVGTGNLELDDADSITVPSGIEIEEVLVESGDTVTKGQTLATVDESSILEAMEDVQDEISTLDSQIQEILDEDDAETIDSSVEGRVKVIYAAADEDISDIMLENGALMLLSLDGYMAVDLSLVSGVSEDDTVTAEFSSGTQVSGTVETVSATQCTVILTDYGTAYGDTVTVYDSEGAVLGTGELYIHQQLAITGTAGIIDSVDVSLNQKVYEDTTLLTLEGTEGQTEYESLLAQREAKTETLQKLIALKKNPVITAEESGTVVSVNVSSSTTTSSGSNSSSSASVSLTSYSSGSVSSKITTSRAAVISLSFTDGGDTVTSESSAAVAYASDFTSESTEETSDTTLAFSVVGSGSCTSSSLVIPVPATGGTPVTSVTAADGSYTGVISWSPSAFTFAEEATYSATITLTAADGYVFESGSIVSCETGTLSGKILSSDGKTLMFTITFPATASSLAEATATPTPTPTPTPTVTSGASSSQESSDDLTDGESTEETTGESGTSSASGSTSGTASSMSGSASSGSSSGITSSVSTGGTSDSSSDASSTTATASTSSSDYSTDVTDFTVSPSDSMLLEVSVDELDINSVEVGQEAVVTLDAIEDEEFTGEVTSLGSTASVSGGVAKYTVVLSIPADSRMKQGMNASATITIETSENVVTIPVNALQEQGNSVFVYTEQAEDGTLSGEVEVTTGLSDGDTVEITEGLSEGDVVYYNRTGSTSSSGDNFDMGSFDMSSFGSFDSGDMPSGGGGGGDMGGGRGGDSMPGGM